VAASVNHHLASLQETADHFQYAEGLNATARATTMAFSNAPLHAAHHTQQAEQLITMVTQLSQQVELMHSKLCEAVHADRSAADADYAQQLQQQMNAAAAPQLQQVAPPAAQQQQQQQMAPPSPQQVAQATAAEPQVFTREQLAARDAAREAAIRAEIASNTVSGSMRQILPRLPVPATFSGNKDAGDVEEALFRFERYLQDSNLPVADWPKYTSNMLTDRALAAWTAVEMPAAAAGNPITWDLFKQSMLSAFAHPDRHARARLQLHTVSQQSNQPAVEYVRYFNALVVRAGNPRSAEEDLLHFFFKGLSSQMKAQCGINPTTGKFWTSLSQLQDHTIVLYTNLARPADMAVRATKLGKRPRADLPKHTPSLRAIKASGSGGGPRAEAKKPRVFGGGYKANAFDATLPAGHDPCTPRACNAHLPAATAAATFDRSGNPIWPEGTSNWWSAKESHRIKMAFNERVKKSGHQV